MPFQKGHIPWNAGLTKETDIRLKLLSENKKQMFKDGKIKKREGRPLPKRSKRLSPELGYVIGVILGDGCLTKRGYIELWTKDKDFADYFAEIIELWCGKKPSRGIDKRTIMKSPTTKKYYRHDKGYRIRLGFTNAALFLKEKIKSLDWVYSTPKWFKKEVLKGLFDSEGCFYIDKKGNGWILFSNENLRLINLFKHLLKEFGINRIYVYKRRLDNQKMFYTVNIHSFPNIKRFSSIITPIIKRKREKLFKYIKNLKNKPYWWTKKEEDILKENYQKISTKKLSKILGRSENSIYHKAMRLGLTNT